MRHGNHMHAIVCHEHGGPEVMCYEEVARPEPGAGEVVVQAEAIGVNYVDTMRRSGRHPAAPAPPFTPGIELAGRIAAVGPGVEGLQVGDRVVARCVSHGSYAEYVRAEARFVAARPESVAAEDGAALMVNGLTAYHALTTVGQLRPGDHVLITAAAGGVGTCAMQIARILEARVIAAAGSAKKLALAKDFGADVLVDYSQPGWSQQVLAATSGQGASLILESVGGDVFAECLRCWAPKGRLVVFGQASGRPGSVTGAELLFGHRTASGLALGTLIENRALLLSSLEQLFQWFTAGRLRVLIGQRFPLREAAAAHRSLEGRRSHGKILLLP